MEFQGNINDTISSLTKNIDTSFIRKSVVPKLISNINKSNDVSSDAKNKLSRQFSNLGSNELRQIRLSSLRGGGDNVTKEALEVIITHFLSDINKFDAKLINLLSNANIDGNVIITFLFVNNIDDIKGVCTSNNIGGSLCQNVITLKKLSALYRIEHNF